NDAHKLIEECMLCANICAAQFLIQNKIPGLFRVHLPPANEKLEALRSYLSEQGLWLGGGEQPTTADFLKLSEVMGDRSDKHLIQMQILRSQQQAVYQPENKGHFGLAYEAYAHFTSPIRRYPDLLVHRAIRSAIRSGKKASHVRRVEGASTLPAKQSYPYDLEAMEAFGQTCSVFERRAEEATRDVDQWLKCEYLQ
ncbi:MAG: RNB domain-containing ribonuclease, partial [Pseudomonadales bacterium]